jgi:hypothetical protein
MSRGSLWTLAFFLVKSFASNLRLHSPDSTRTTIMPGLKHLLQDHDETGSSLIYFQDQDLVTQRAFSKTFCPLVSKGLVHT